MDHKMDIRIVSEGRRYDTMIYGPDDKPLQHVTQFTLTGDWANGVQAELWIKHPALNVRVPDATVHIANQHISLLEVRNSELAEELRVTNDLLATRQEVLEALPPCPLHGPGCVPFALEWIRLRWTPEKAPDAA